MAELILVGKKLYQTKTYLISCKSCNNTNLSLNKIDTNIVYGYCSACNLHNRYDLRKSKGVQTKWK